MKVLLIGSGAREHALAKALARSTHPVEIYNIGTHINPGIVKLAREISLIPVEQAAEIVAFATQKQIDFAIIGPEKPLELGLADHLIKANIPVIGPTQQLAQIESSKGFARDLMKKYQLAGLPLYQRFPHFTPEAKDFIESLNGQYVIKADGLMSGKGVKVAGDHLFSIDAAVAFCQEINGPFVVEEKLVGPEFSLLSFSDGHTLAHMPAVQDHKRLLVGDQGPNTGGMGTFTMANHLLPFLTPADIKDASAINESVVAALRAETGALYCGILYGGFMKTATGIKVIEYNARFGDPESINLLALLDTDFVDLCTVMTAGRMQEINVRFKNQASVCKYLVPQGYPDAGQKGGVLNLSALQNQAALYYASVEAAPENIDQNTESNTSLTMLGSRALAVLELAPTPAEAEGKVERHIAAIKGDFYHRVDIGK